MNVSTVTAEIKSLNAQIEEAITSKRTNCSILLSTCTENDAINGMLTIKSQYMSTIDGIMPQMAAKKSELVALKQK